MTTPRDAIGLSERMRQMPSSLNDACRTMEEAATQLDAQAARVKELEAERDQMAEVLASPLADKVVEYADRAARAEQERDEAYERAATLVDARADHLLAKAKRTTSPSEKQCFSRGVELRQTAYAIRRLAAGDEEGK